MWTRMDGSLIVVCLPCIRSTEAECPNNSRVMDNSRVIPHSRFDSHHPTFQLTPPVSRITATSSSTSMHLTLDIANELYPLSASENFTLAIARSLVPERDAEEAEAEEEEGAPKKIRRELWRDGNQGLADEYDYVMYGKVGALS
jgi:DNA-directed RNA polymerase I, II, and III subunit RPABC3